MEIYMEIGFDSSPPTLPVEAKSMKRSAASFNDAGLAAAAAGAGSGAGGAAGADADAGAGAGADAGAGATTTAF